VPQLEDVLAACRARFAADSESTLYIRTHAPRYRVLLELVATALAGRPGARVLDVGPSYQTEAIRELHSEATVDTLGFEDPRLRPREGDRHIAYDLNDADRRETWPQALAYDLVVFAEVLEHLTTAPQHVLSLLRSLLRDDGTLILQTPNAASLPKRLKLLAGRHPFEQIRESRAQAGHFREYTRAELVALARRSGLEPSEARLASYFAAARPRDRLLVAAGPLLPPTLREGITLVLRPA
jgi:trans-aconitate methyltransferase